MHHPTFHPAALLFVGCFLFGCAGGEDPPVGPVGGPGGAGGTAGDGGSGPDASISGFIAHYHTAWTTPHIHFNSDGAWTSLPGKLMSPEEGGWYVYEHDTWNGSLEFVFNDGGEQWDNNEEENYTTQLREFWVKGGEVFGSKPGTGQTFCDEVDCGPGVCNESAQRCDCNPGHQYDSSLRTCVEDLCAGVHCGDSLCDPNTGQCVEACDPDKTVGSFRFCVSTSESSYAVVVEYIGSGQLDLGASDVRLNGASVDLSSTFDTASQTFRIAAADVEPSKYSYLLRMKQQGGQGVDPLFIPFWIGSGIRYADFKWKDAILYQIMTDRFRNGDMSNDLDNSVGSLAEVDDVRSQWQGGDFKGIIDKIEDGYFESMGINALWISSPVLNSHNSQTSVNPNDARKFSSYHAYHPIATGHTHLNDFGYPNPIETAFGTPAELHELVNKAHAQGIRIIPDFVANHVQLEANIYLNHEDWFHPYVPCHDNWEAHRIDCWFTTTTPDINFSVAAARKAVIDHAIWLIHEFNFDGYRADALKHMQDVFVQDLKTAVKQQVETTVKNHDLSEEPTIFYMVGESLGWGWPRYHVRADMVQGQVDQPYYHQVKEALLTFQRSVRDLADFAIPNDTAYLTPQEVHGSHGGYPGAVMGNYMGNHDEVRALTEAGGDHRRLRLAQTFLMTSPGNIPMLYQGDDIGMFGGPDPDNRKMMVFSGLSADQQASLENMRRLGKAREASDALRRGSRQSVIVEDWFWVYKVSHQGEEIYVAINRDNPKDYAPPAGYTDVLGNCVGSTVPSLSSCVFVK